MCTGIMLKAKDGSVVHGRTVEFGIAVDTTLVVVPRSHQFVAKTPRGDGLEYSAKYAAVGLITYDDLTIMDGLNEAGFSAAAFYFPTFAGYTPVTDANQTKAVSPGDFPNWLLTQFATVDEARRAIEAGSVVIAPTVLEGWGPDAPPFHYVAYDASGASIVIEPVDGRLLVHDNPLGVVTNSPPFDWHMTNLRNYVALDPGNVPHIEVDGTSFEQLGQGSGMVGLPGDFTPPSRFVRAAVFSACALPSDTAEQAVEQVFHVLNNFDIPLGVARGEAAGVVRSDHTQVTTARDPKNLRYYYRTYADQTLRMVDLTQFDLDAADVKRLSTESHQSIVDMSQQVR